MFDTRFIAISFHTITNDYVTPFPPPRPPLLLLLILPLLISRPPSLLFTTIVDSANVAAATYCSTALSLCYCAAWPSDTTEPQVYYEVLVHRLYLLVTTDTQYLESARCLNAGGGECFGSSRNMAARQDRLLYISTVGSGQLHPPKTTL